MARTVTSVARRAMPLTPDDFTRLYRRHAQPLLVYFQRRVHDAELAADLLAETFTAAIAAADGYRGSSEAELAGWLWAIARSTLAEHNRRRDSDRRRWRRLGRARVALSDREIERVEELAASAQLREAVARRLDELPPDQRDAVRLRVLEERPYQEVAEQMRISPVAARARVSRGLRALELSLGPEHEAWREDSA